MEKNSKADIARAIRAANRLLNPFAISDPSQIDLEALAKGRDVLVWESDLEGAEARLIRSSRRAGIIRIRPNSGGVGRRRFTIAHELGHWELHSEYSQGNICSTKDIEDYKGSRIEVEANHFASELLMPTGLFRPRCENVEPDVLRIQELAEEFRASQRATAIRFVEECRSMCIVIFSEDGIVKWWKDGSSRRDIGRRFWIPSRYEIPAETGTWICAQGGKTSGPMDEVNPLLWLPGLPDDHGLRIREQSIRLGVHSDIMTLLWIFEL